MKNIKNTLYSNIAGLVVVVALLTSCNNPAKQALESLPPIPQPGQQGQEQPVDEAAQLKVWKELLGHYNLVQFDGRNVKSRPTSIHQNFSSFYDKKKGQYLESIIFPLFSHVADNTDQTYNIGPIQGLGQSTFSESNGTKVYQYTLNDRINWGGYDVGVELSIQTVKEGNMLHVLYKLKMSDTANPVEKLFTLTSSN